MNRLAHLLNQEQKWIGNMSKDELVKGHEEYQKLVELDKKQQTEKK